MKGRPARLRIYFDTNVYRLVALADEAKQMREWLNESNHSVIASNDNLVETWAAPLAEMGRRVQAITCIAYTFDDRPHSLRHADEVIREIRRARPRWLRRFRDRRLISSKSRFLGGHQEGWAHAKRSPDVRPLGLREYRQDADTADLGRQKSARSALVQALGRSDRAALRFESEDPSLAALTESYPAWEVAVRHGAAGVWHFAVNKRAPSMRDYYDWMAPYVNADCLVGDDYMRFWLRDVRLRAIPFNVVTGLAEYYQLFHKVSHGNFIDVLHANYLLTTDLMITADKSFHRVMTDISGTVSVRAEVDLIDPGSSPLRSVVDAVHRVSNEQSRV